MILGSCFEAETKMRRIINSNQSCEFTWRLEIKRERKRLSEMKSSGMLSFDACLINFGGECYPSSCLELSGPGLSGSSALTEVRTVHRHIVHSTLMITITASFSLLIEYCGSR